MATTEELQKVTHQREFHKSGKTRLEASSKELASNLSELVIQVKSLNDSLNQAKVEHIQRSMPQNKRHEWYQHSQKTVELLQPVLKVAMDQFLERCAEEQKNNVDRFKVKRRVQYRRSKDMSDSVTDEPGPNQGDLVDVVAVDDKWLELENGLFLPRYSGRVELVVPAGGEMKVGIAGQTISLENGHAPILVVAKIAQTLLIGKAKLLSQIASMALASKIQDHPDFKRLRGQLMEIVRRLKSKDEELSQMKKSVKLADKVAEDYIAMLKTTLQKHSVTVPPRSEIMSQYMTATHVLSGTERPKPRNLDKYDV